MRHEYHYLVAGLPDFTFDDKKTVPPVPDFKNTLKEHLLPDDYKLIEFLFLTYDNQNLLSFLKIKKHQFNPLGNFKVEDFEDEINRQNAIMPENPSLPWYICRFIEMFHDENAPKSDFSWENQLTLLYFEYVLECPNAFLKNWFEFELNLRNTITAIISRKFEYNTETEIIGNNEVAKLLKKNPSKDFGLAIEFPYIEKILQIADIPKIPDRERNYDLLRWTYLDEQTNFHYFDIEFIAGYLIKLMIVHHWLGLDEQTGRAMFNQMVSGIEKSYEFPEEFKI